MVLKCTGTANIADEEKQIKEKYKRMIWKSFQMEEQIFEFLGNEKLPPQIQKLSGVLEFFKYFFDDEVMKLIVDESNLFSVQTSGEFGKTICNQELYKLLGICIMSSVHRVNNTRRYWSYATGNVVIQKCMTQKLFEKIKSIIHFNNNDNMLPRDNESFDKLFKIRPFVELLLSKFKSVPKEKLLSVDEQMCSTKAKNSIRQNKIRLNQINGVINYLPSPAYRDFYTILKFLVAPKINSGS